MWAACGRGGGGGGGGGETGVMKSFPFHYRVGVGLCWRGEGRTRLLGGRVFVIVR